MAGTLVANTINTDTGLFSTQNAYNGVARAWATWTGSTGAILGSFNVSSITRTAAGQYTVSFTTAMPNANYSCTTGGAMNSGSNSAYVSTGSVGTNTASTVYIGSVNSGGYTDLAYIAITVHSA
jgi:hypothetical protein